MMTHDKYNLQNRNKSVPNLNKESAQGIVVFLWLVPTVAQAIMTRYFHDTYFHWQEIPVSQSSGWYRGSRIDVNFLLPTAPIPIIAYQKLSRMPDYWFFSHEIQ